MSVDLKLVISSGVLSLISCESCGLKGGPLYRISFSHAQEFNYVCPHCLMELGKDIYDLAVKMTKP